MSKGTRMAGVRLPPELLAEIVRAIARRNRHARDAPWKLSDFLRIAAQEKLAKMERSRGGKRKFPANPVVAWKEEDTQRLRVPGSDSDPEFLEEIWGE